MTIPEAIQEMKKSRGNSEAKRIAIACMEYLRCLENVMTDDDITRWVLERAEKLSTEQKSFPQDVDRKQL